jgi:VanZ family protein
MMTLLGFALCMIAFLLLETNRIPWWRAIAAAVLLGIGTGCW